MSGEITTMGAMAVAVVTLAEVSKVSLRALINKKNGGSSRGKCALHDGLENKMEKIELAVCGDGSDQNKGLVRKMDGVHAKLDSLIKERDKEAR
jgi:hypothetical protein